MSGSEEEVEDGMEGADSDEENSDAELEPVEENYVCLLLQTLFVACSSSIESFYCAWLESLF